MTRPTMLASGRSLNPRFTLLHPLEAGGMGEVWLVHDSDLDKELVAKIVPDNAADDRNALLLEAASLKAASLRTVSLRDLLLRECRSSRSLEHPNIVGVDGLHRGGGYDFITMPHIDGRPISRLRGVTPAEILDAVIPLANALAHAHRRGIVHRDLKAGNVLLDEAGQPHLLDFGIAGWLDGSDNLRGGGTRHHVSPQQAAGEPASPADDIYALGVLLHELLVGGEIDTDPTTTPTCRPLVSNHPVPQRLISLVESMLRKSPTDRPTDAETIEQTLQEVRDDLRLAESPRLSDPPRLTPPPRGRAEPQLIVPPKMPAPDRQQPTATRHRGAYWLTAVLFGVLGLATLGVFLVLPDWVRQERMDRAATAKFAQPTEPRDSTVPDAAKPEPDGTEPTGTGPVADDSSPIATPNATTDDDIMVATAIDAPEIAPPTTGEVAAEPASPVSTSPVSTAQVSTAQVSTTHSATAPQPAKTSDERAFQEAMSQGLAALDLDDYSAARQAFSQASELRPGSPQSADGLARAEIGLRVSSIAELQRQARASAGDEAWTAAAEHYQSILEIDPNIEMAQTGRAHSLERAELARKLTRHIDQPDRLSSDAVLVDASTALAKAREIEAPGDRLERQIAELAGLVEAFSTPVQARLESDTLTDVVVYKVGRLGTFDRRDLELRPGTYTVVGSRRGYRDVRRQLVIAPGTAPAPLAIRCEEEI